MGAEERKQQASDQVDRLYQDVYRHLDDVLAQVDRSLSEKLTDIRMTRQQLDQSMR